MWYSLLYARVFGVGHDSKEHDTADDEAQSHSGRHRQRYTYTRQRQYWTIFAAWTSDNNYTHGQSFARGPRNMQMTTAGLIRPKVARASGCRLQPAKK